MGANEKASLIQYLSDAWTQLQSDSETAANGESLHRHYSVKTKDIKTFAPSCSRGNRTRFFLKVQDGCDNFCSYCVVPYTRGRSRSRNKDSILKEAKSLIENGVRELIIGGIDTGSYHDPENPSYRLKDLLKDRLDISSLPYRILSLIHI